MIRKQLLAGAAAVVVVVVVIGPAVGANFVPVGLVHFAADSYASVLSFVPHLDGAAVPQPLRLPHSKISRAAAAVAAAAAEPRKKTIPVGGRVGS